MHACGGLSACIPSGVEIPLLLIGYLAMKGVGQQLQKEMANSDWNLRN